MEPDDLIILNDSSFEDNLTEEPNPIPLFNQGNWKSALLISKRMFSNPSSSLEFLIEVFKSSNLLIGRLVKGQNMNLAVEIAKKIIKQVPRHLLSHFMEYHCENLNEIACGYKNISNIYLAKKFIDRALHLVKDYRHSKWDKSTTFLNTCAILSKIGKHEEALKYSKKAIRMINDEIVQIKLTEGDRIKDIMVKLSIGFQNHAVQFEYLGKTEKSLEYYEKSYKLLDEYDPKNLMADKFKSNYLNVKKNLDKKNRTKTTISHKNLAVFTSTDRLSKPSNKVKNDLESLLESTSSKKNLLYRTDKGFYTQKYFEPVKDERFSTASNKNIRIRKINRNQEDFRGTKAPVVKSPRNGIENIRKAVLNEVYFKMPESQSLRNEISSSLTNQTFQRKSVKSNISASMEDTERVQPKDLTHERDEKIEKEHKNLADDYQKKLTRPELQKLCLLQAWVKGMIVRKNKENRVLIKSCTKEMGNNEYRLEFHYWKNYKKVSIKAFNIENSCAYFLNIFDVQFDKAESLINYLEDEIEPYLTMQRFRLVVEKEKKVREREVLAKGRRLILTKDFLFTVSKVETDFENVIEIVGEDLETDNKQVVYFHTNEILKKLKRFEITNVLNNPHFVILILDLRRNRIVLKNLKKQSVSIVHNSTIKIKNITYPLKIFSIDDTTCYYYIQLYSKEYPSITSLSIPSDKFSEIFKASPNPNPSISEIVKFITIKSNKVSVNTDLIKISTLAESKLNYIVLIQSNIRGYLSRDKHHFDHPKKNLIYSTSHKIKEISCTVNFFKLKSSFLIEVLSPDLKKSFYSYIQKPSLFFSKVSRLFDVKLITCSLNFNEKTFFFPTLKGSLKFTECSFFSPDELVKSFEPIISFKMNTESNCILITRSFENKIVVKLLKLLASPSCLFQEFLKDSLVKEKRIFSAEEVIKKINIAHGAISLGNDLANGKFQIKTSGEKHLYRTTEKFDGKLYSVNILTEDDDKNLVFQFRTGVSNTAVHIVKISIEEALEKSGFIEGFIIPMALFMLKNMIRLEDGKFLLKAPEPKFDIQDCLAKIIRCLKIYKIRMDFKTQTMFNVIHKTELKIENEAYKALIYFSRNDYHLLIMKYPLILTRRLNKRLIRSHEDKAETNYFSKILSKIKLKEKNGELKIAGLKQWKSPPQSNNYESALARSSTLTERSPASTFSKFPEIFEKVLKWRAPREVSGQKCIISVFEYGNAGLVEAFILSSSKTLSLHIEMNLIKDPSLLASQLEIKDSNLIIKNEPSDVVLIERGLVSGRLADITIFKAEQGYYSTVFLINEKRTLNTFLGTSINPNEAAKNLAIKMVMNQEVLVLSN